VIDRRTYLKALENLPHRLSSFSPIDSIGGEQKKSELQERLVTFVPKSKKGSSVGSRIAMCVLRKIEVKLSHRKNIIYYLISQRKYHHGYTTYIRKNLKF